MKMRLAAAIVIAPRTFAGTLLAGAQVASADTTIRRELRVCRRRRDFVP